MSSLQQQLQTPSKSFSDSKLNLPTPSNLFANTSILSHHVSAPNMNANSTVLPPCSSILLSPNESCVRNSYHKSFTTPNTTNIDENDVTNKSIILPSLDSIIPSPSIKRSLSTNTPALPLPTNLNRHNSNDSFYPKIPQTPTANSLPNINSFVQSTPIPAYNLFPSKHQSSTPINTKITDSENIFKVNPVALKKRKSCCSNETDYNTDTEGSESLNSSKSFAFISHSQATFLSNEPDIDNARLARRKRRRTSPNELSILQNEFALGTTPNKQRRISIAKSVNMTEKEVQIWFQNKRQALRKSQNNNKREYHLQTDKSTTINITPATSLSPTSSVVSSSSLDSDDMNAEKIVPKIIIDENKENVNPFTGSTPKKENLPPTGVFSSPGKIPLRDITNQHLSSSGAPSQTFKFKPAEFGLPNSGNPVSKRQKPTMKLKIKSAIAPQSNQDLIDCINVLTTPKST